jgi:hypothetical protein
MKVYYGYELRHEGLYNKYEEYIKCFELFCEFIGYKERERMDGFYIDKYIQALGGQNRKYLFEGRSNA